MDDRNDKGIWGILILIFLFFIVFSGDGFGGGNRGRGGYGEGTGCNRVSNCEVERQTIINTATTQNMIQSEADKTRDQASRIFEAQNAEKLFDSKMKIMQLEGIIFNTKEFCEIKADIKDIRCNCLEKPQVYGTGYVLNGCPVPCNTGCGVA